MNSKEAREKFLNLVKKHPERIAVGGALFLTSVYTLVDTVNPRLLDQTRNAFVQCVDSRDCREQFLLQGFTRIVRDGDSYS